MANIRYSRLKYLIIVVAYVVIVCHSVHVHADDSNVKVLFESEYPAARAEWHRVYDTLPVSRTILTETKSNGSTVRKSEMIDRKHGDNYVRASRFLISPPQEGKNGATPSFAYGRNSHYFFELDYKNDSWLVRQLVQPSPSFEDSANYVGIPHVRSFLFPNLQTNASKPIGAMSATYDDFDSLSSSPSFVLISLGFHSGNQRLVRVDYKSQRRDMNDWKLYTAVNWVVFDRDLKWAMVEYHSDHGDLNRAVHYDHVNTFNTDSKYPSLSTTRTTLTTRGGGKESVEETESTHNVRYGDVPEVDFSLTSFGLPEPPGISWKQPTPNYVWLLCLAVGFAGIAIATQFLVRRRRAIAERKL